MPPRAYPDTRRIGMGRFTSIFLPAGLFVIWITMKLFFPDQYLSLIQEDGALENLQASFYALAGILCFVIGYGFVRGRPWRLLGCLYALLGIVLILAALEEISWGQRIFGIETPEALLDLNTQQEISIHNLEPVQSKLHLAYILVGLFCFTGWRLLRVPSVRSNRLSEFIIPDKSIRFYFLPVTIVYIYSDYIGNRLWNLTGNMVFRVQTENNFLLWRDQEPAEFFLAIGFMMFAVNNLINQKIRSDSEHSELT